MNAGSLAAVVFAAAKAGQQQQQNYQVTAINSFVASAHAAAVATVATAIAAAAEQNQNQKHIIATTATAVVSKAHCVWSPRIFDFFWGANLAGGAGAKMLGPKKKLVLACCWAPGPSGRLGAGRPCFLGTSQFFLVSPELFWVRGVPLWPGWWWGKLSPGLVDPLCVGFFWGVAGGFWQIVFWVARQGRFFVLSLAVMHHRKGYTSLSPYYVIDKQKVKSSIWARFCLTKTVTGCKIYASKDVTK